MKIWNYCKYFFYLAWNWTFQLAVFVLYYEIKGEKKYKLFTTGTDTLHRLEDKGIDISHATMYMPINYYILEKLMDEIRKYPNNKTFLDIGCGRGRAMAVASYYGYEKITGIDFSSELCNAAIRTASRCQQVFPAARFTIINNDAFYFEIPNDVSTIFLFNPFDEVITGGVVANIIKSQQQHPRGISVIYANPLYKTLFMEEGFVETYHIKKLEYLEGSVLRKEAG